jgi:hypothetical protein
VFRPCGYLALGPPLRRMRISSVDPSRASLCPHCAKGRTGNRGHSAVEDVDLSRRAWSPARKGQSEQCNGLAGDDEGFCPGIAALIGGAD